MFYSLDLRAPGPQTPKTPEVDSNFDFDFTDGGGVRVREGLNRAMARKMI